MKAEDASLALLRQSQDKPRCPRCGEERLVERVGKDLVCNVCSAVWPPSRPS